MSEVYGFNGAVTFGTGIKAGGDVHAFSGELDLEKITIPAKYGSKMKKTKLGSGSFKATIEMTITHAASGTQPFDNTNAGMTGSIDWLNFYGVVTLQCDKSTGGADTIVGTMAFCNFKFKHQNGQAMTGTWDIENSEDDLTITWPTT